MILPDKNQDGPAFAEPWEARIFAIVVALNASGRFEWKTFQALLAEEIRAAEDEGAGRPYYASWLAAAERLLAGLKLSNRDEVDAIVDRLRPGVRNGANER